MNMADKLVFITGASSGIGLACAHQFAAAGARLLLCARSGETLKNIANDLEKEYASKVYTFVLDVRDKVAVEQSLSALPVSWKSIDILINNAGLAAGLDHLQTGLIEDWDAMIDTNVKGLLYVTRFVVPCMIERGAGHIINIGSIAGYESYAKGTVYCATKSAVKTITEGLRKDLVDTPVRVSTVDPGLVETNFSRVRFKGDAQRASAVYQGIEALTPNDIADSVLYCATRPAHVNIAQMLVLPAAQASVTMVSRK